MEHPKIKYPRMIEGAKNEIRKYLKRERRKELPEGIDFWDFDCKFGDTEADAKPVHLKEIDECINDAEKRGLMSFYVEVVRKEGIRKKKNMPHKAALPKLKGFGE
jgi:hypothetical protein